MAKVTRAKIFTHLWYAKEAEEAFPCSRTDLNTIMCNGVKAG